ncbi:MAG: glycosyltransferase [Bacteroidia bacterium]
MKILILSDINSSHTQKWVSGLSQRGIDVAVFSISAPASDWHVRKGIKLLGNTPDNKRTAGRSLLSKASYLQLIPGLRKAIDGFQPDLLHAHYASSYGFLGALSGFHPFVISAWGSDLMEFPLKNIVNRKIVKYNLAKADLLLATSKVLVDTIAKYSDKRAVRIPFGINTAQFAPETVASLFPESSTVVGTIKSLETIYGIDVLLNAFRIAADQPSGRELRLLIVGGGSKEEEYKRLAGQLGILEKVVFAGRVAHDEASYYHNMIDIFVNVSRNESFGVSVLEASACGKPVIVSEVGGLPEVVIKNETGFCVPPEGAMETAKAIGQLAGDPALRKRMGSQGRAFVQQHFDLDKNVDEMLRVYEKLIIKK